MFFLAITLIPFTLYLLHFLTDIRTKADLKRRIIDIYVIFGELSEAGRVNEALASLRRTMIHSKKWFLIYYACVSFACILSTVPYLTMSPRDQLEEGLIELSDTVIDLHYSLTFDLGMLVSPPGFFFNDNGTSCVANKGTWNFVDSKPGQREKITAAIRSLTNAELKWVYALSEILSDLFTFFTVGVAIVISMRATLFLMSRLAGSGLWLLCSTALSIAIAMLSPFVMIELSTYIATTTVVTLRGGLPDFFGINTPSILNMAIAHATTMTIVLLNPESILAVVWQKIMPDSWITATMFNSVMSIATIQISWGRLLLFVQDLVRFNGFDFNGSALDGIRNWGAGTDIAFSLSYLVLSLLLVAAHRREAVREYMMKELQEIDSSKDGPILSLANKTKLLMTAAVALIGKKN